MHLNDGELRAYLDHQMETAERDQARKHLAACGACRVHAEALQRARRVRDPRVGCAQPRPGADPCRTPQRTRPFAGAPE